MNGYVIAVQGMPEWAIGNAVRSFIRGTVPGQDKKFCPRAPEFSIAVRNERDSVLIDAAKPATGKHIYSFKPPRSAVLERRCTKDWARQLVNQGVYPKGSIWVPGEFGEHDQHIGTLFGPDEEWQPAKPIERVAA